jgi:hypothetical protein
VCVRGGAKLEGSNGCEGRGAKLDEFEFEIGMNPKL